MNSKKKFDTIKYFHPSEKIFLKIYIKNKEYWEEAVIEKRVGRVLDMIKGLNWVHKRPLNQLKKRYLDNRDTISEEQMIVMMYLYLKNIFTRRTNKKKRNPTETLNVDLKRMVSREIEISKGEVLYGKIFPLQVQRKK